MNKEFLEITGWIFAGISVIVNILQYFKNGELKKQVSKQNIGNNSEGTQQTHSGTGHNISARGNVNVDRP